MRRHWLSAERNRQTERLDMPLLLIVLFFCGLGITTLYSGSAGYGERVFGDPLYFVRRQLINLGVGLIAMAVFATVSLDWLRGKLPLFVGLALLALFLPFLPVIGISRNGASRWFGLGSYSFQPSELAKLALILFLANILAKKHDRLDEPKVSIYPAAFMSIIFLLVIYLQNDFSTTIFLLLTVMALFFAAGVKLRWFFMFALLALPLVALMVLTKEYRVERILSFMHPDRDPLGAGYQVNAALDALTGGGFWGRGLGNGIRKISSIPEVQSDFIFAVWAEEMGFFGVLCYFATLIAFALRGFFVSLTSPDRFRTLLGIGASLLIFLQSVINCGVVVRAFPATGIPLPFFSSGGSSLLITLCLCGLLINVSKKSPGGEFNYV